MKTRSQLEKNWRLPKKKPSFWLMGFVRQWGHKYYLINKNKFDKIFKILIKKKRTLHITFRIHFHTFFRRRGHSLGFSWWWKHGNNFIGLSQESFSMISDWFFISSFFLVPYSIKYSFIRNNKIIYQQIFYVFHPSYQKTSEKTVQFDLLAT